MSGKRSVLAREAATRRTYGPPGRPLACRVIADQPVEWRRGGRRRPTSRLAGANPAAAAARCCAQCGGVASKAGARPAQGAVQAMPVAPPDRPTRAPIPQ